MNINRWKPFILRRSLRDSPNCTRREWADGYSSRVLFESGGTNGFSLIYAWFKRNFPLTAHLHNADCLYFVIGGELALGKGVASEIVRAGDGFFVPAGHMYGYTAGPEGVEILEFRSVSKFNIEYKSQPPSAWAGLAAVMAANRNQWKTDRTPRAPGAAAIRRRRLPYNPVPGYFVFDGPPASAARARIDDLALDQDHRISVQEVRLIIVKLLAGNRMGKDRVDLVKS